MPIRVFSRCLRFDPDEIPKVKPISLTVQVDFTFAPYDTPMRGRSLGRHGALPAEDRSGLFATMGGLLMTISSMIVGMLITGCLLLLAGWMTDALRVVERPRSWDSRMGDPITYNEFPREIRASN